MKMIFKHIKSWFCKSKESEPMFTDVFGDELHKGDLVLRVKYNDLRSNYVTVECSKEVIPFNECIKFKVLKYDTFNNASKSYGRKHGYIHVSR